MSREPNKNVCIKSDPRNDPEWFREFWRRVDYISQNYAFGIRFIGGSREQNAAINQIKNALGKGPEPGTSRARINPMIEMVVSENARKVAHDRTGEDDSGIECEDIESALHKTVSDLKIKQGAPAAAILRYHVEGLVALIEQMTGYPVRVSRYRGTENYVPHFPSGVSQLVEIIFRKIDPSVRVWTLVDLVNDTRRKRRTERKTFADYFPLYGAHMDADGNVQLGFGLELERFRPNIPIYFPVPASP